MKKITVLILLTFAVSISFAQFSIGPKIGYNQSTTTMEAKNITVSKVYGFVYGVTMNIGSTVSFQPEILFMQKGMRIDSTINDDYFAHTNNYLEVPLLLNFGFGNEKRRFYVNFGPYFGYWLNGKVEEKVNGKSSTYDYVFDDDIEDDGKEDYRLDYGFAGGAGVHFKIWKGLLSFEIRYDYGFDDIITVKEGGPSYVSTRNRTIAGMIAYAITL